MKSREERFAEKKAQLNQRLIADGYAPMPISSIEHGSLSREERLRLYKERIQQAVAEKLAASETATITEEELQIIIKEARIKYTILREEYEETKKDVEKLITRLKIENEKKFAEIRKSVNKTSSLLSATIRRYKDSMKGLFGRG